jgi:CHASE2 domain-containing sensor protein/signal transduction histidine kinase
VNLRLRLAMEWVSIGLFATSIVCAALFWRGTASFDNLLYDQLSAVQRPQADRDILLVTIDDRSLATLGKWPWDRNIHARLITKIQQKQPRAIAFDILLSEPGEQQADRNLAAALASGPAQVFIPHHFITPGNDGRNYDAVLPVPVFRTAAKGLGHVNIQFDDDGIVRRTALCFNPEDGGKALPHLMTRLLETQRKDAANHQCDDTLLIPYAKRGSFAEISYADILENDVPDDLVRDKYVIIGATAAGMGDNFPTPNGEGGVLSGIEIMANILAASRRDNFTRPLPGPWNYVLSLAPLWLLMIGFLRFRPRVVLIASLASLVGILVISVGLLSNRIWHPPSTAILGILMVYPLWGWRRLQAMSDFMAVELRSLDQTGETRPLPIPQNPATDMVGRQSEALASAIGHMRDLRRFVSDTLADLPDPMFVTDPQRRITLTNKLLDERLDDDISGWLLDDALELMVIAEQRAIVDDYIGQSQAHGQEFVRFLSPTGLTFVMRRSEVRSDAGILHGHIHYLTDITALAKAEEDREEVLQLLSHDMRAPQSTIIALLDGPMDAEARKRIERNARRTIGLAQDFVEIARMGERDFVGEDVILVDLVRESADSLWPLAHERGISFSFHDSSDSAFVCAEPESLHRAVCNLIDNAIKFSPDNSSIAIEVSRHAGAHVAVAISDQGSGIDAEILPTLFSRFASVRHQKGRVRGVGLGLSFVHAVITRHKGMITAQNGENGGGLFMFTLPEAKDPEAQ